MKKILLSNIIAIFLSLNIFGIISINSDRFIVEKQTLQKKLKIVNPKNNIYAGEIVITSGNMVKNDDFILSEFLILLQPFEEKEVLIQYIGDLTFPVEKNYIVNLETVPLLAETTHKKTESGRDTKLSVIASFGKGIRIQQKENFTKWDTSFDIKNDNFLLA